MLIKVKIGQNGLFGETTTLRYLNRAAARRPSYFDSQDALRGREALLDYFSLNPDRRGQTRPPIVGMAVESAEVRAALGRLFNGKCAFCERTSVLQAHRFRPRSNVSLETAGHEEQSYYIWLSDEWDNLYPICAQCVVGSKGNDFPVIGKRAPIPTREQIQLMIKQGAKAAGLYPPLEDPLPLDPCQDQNLGDHLAFTPSGQILPRTARGLETIRRYSLARKALVKRRGDVFGLRLAKLRSFIADEPSSVSAQEALNQDGGGEFLGGWAMLVKELAKELQGRVPTAEELGTASHFAALRAKKGILASFDIALKRLDEVKGWTEGETAAPARRSDPELRAVQIENFKALESVYFKLPSPVADAAADDSAAPSILLLGENSAGKSTILEAIAIALSPGIFDALSLRVEDYRLDPSFLSGKGPARAARVRLDLGARRHRSVAIDETISHSGSKDLPPVFGYGAYRMFTRSAENTVVASGVASLFRPELPLANPERWLLGLDASRLTLVAQALRFILGIEDEFEVIELDRENKRCLLVQQPAGRDTALVKSPLETISSGYRAVLAMACDMMKGMMEEPDFKDFGTASAIVLVDEIEAHLHPRWKMQIMAGLRKAFPRATFVATTHDPLCLRSMRDGEAILVRRHVVEGGELPVAVEVISDLPPVTTLTVEQLLTSDHFGLYSTDSPVAEADFAAVADILAKERLIEEAVASGEQPPVLSVEEQEVLSRFRDTLAAALPIGATELQRMIQDELARYLKEKRRAPHHRVQQLKTSTRLAIADALSRL
jgi:hypothetical protein